MNKEDLIKALSADSAEKVRAKKSPAQPTDKKEMLCGTMLLRLSQARMEEEESSIIGKKSKSQLTFESDLRRGIQVKSFKLHKDEIAEFERLTRICNMTNRAMLILMMNEFKQNHGIE